MFTLAATLSLCLAGTSDQPEVYALIRVSLYPAVGTLEDARRHQIGAKLKHPAVLKPAIERAGATKFKTLQGVEDPAAWLAKSLHAEFTGDVLRVGLRGDHPDELAALVNAVAEAYAGDKLAQERRYMADRAASCRKNIADSEARIREIEKRMAIYPKDSPEWLDEIQLIDHYRGRIARDQVMLGRYERNEALGLPKGEILQKAQAPKGK